MVVDDGVGVTVLARWCACWSSRGGLCITDGASECQGQAVHFFARLRENVCVCARVWPMAWEYVERPSDLYCDLSSVVCLLPKHDRCIGTRISGQPSLLVFFFYCFRVFFPFVFCFARGGGEIGAANKVMELKGCLGRGYVNYVNTEILKGIRGNFCTMFPSR